MPIRIAFDQNSETPLGRGAAGPIFVCAHCHERIRDGALGVYLFSPDANKNGAITPTEFAHKGQCHDALEATGAWPGWGELRSFIGFLAMNAQLHTLLSDEKDSLL